MANLYAAGIRGSSPGKGPEMLREAFETNVLEAAWERDANTMAAAQWILWHGQTLFKLIIYDHLEEGQNDKGNWWLGKAFAGPLMQPRSIERWRFWREGFETVETRLDASEDCKRVSKRAADLMASMERDMLF
jgi:hypothetical protein